MFGRGGTVNVVLSTEPSFVGSTAGISKDRYRKLLRGEYLHRWAGTQEYRYFTQLVR